MNDFIHFKITNSTNIGSFFDSLQNRKLSWIKLFGVGRASEQQNCKASNTKIDEASATMCHKWPKIRSHYALPSSTVHPVKFLPNFQHKISIDSLYIYLDLKFLTIVTVKSHIDWKWEQNISYKNMKTSLK